jgi:hypothetical protein
MNFEILPYVPPPTLHITCTRPGTSSDYAPFMYGDTVKTDRVNDPDLMDFALVPSTGFVKLKRGDYIVFATVTYPNWFTGYVTNDPELEYLGMGAGRTPVWGYKYQLTSDEYLLNMKPLGILAPFMNTTQGSILKELVNRLAPGKFDVTGIQDGQRISRYVADPSKAFSDIVKDFADAANFRFSANSHSLLFAPQDSAPAALVVDGQDPHFTPAGLQVKPSTDPIINDAIVLGDIEPQGYYNEYFVGDAATGHFPLIGSPFGIESAVLLDELFSGSTLDEQKWNVYDTPSNFLRLDNGFLNVLGGMQFADLGVFLTSASLLPIEGNLRLTHGEYDFVDTASQGINGVIAGLWANAPQMNGVGGYNGCFYGIEVSKSGATSTLRPIIGGSVDGTQSLILNFSQRYIIRTILSAKRIFRSIQEWSFVGQDGSVGKFGGGGMSDVLTYTTIITALDPVAGNVTGQTVWSNSGITLDGTQVFAYYTPVASNDLHCTLTNITISTPMQASLAIKAARSIANFGGGGGGDFLPGRRSFRQAPSEPSYVLQTIGPNEIDSYDGQSPMATIQTTNQGISQKSSILGSPKYNPGNAALEFFKDSTKQTSTIPQIGDIIHLSYRQAGVAIGRVQSKTSILTEAGAWGDNGLRSVTRKDISPPPRTSAECEAAAAAIVQDSAYGHYEGEYTVYSPGFGTTGEPLAGTILQFRNLPSDVFPVIPVQAGVDENGDPLPAPAYTSNFAESIHEVKTTLLSGRPQEYFQHDITFGRVDSLRKTLSRFDRPKDVFSPQDAAEMPDAVNVPAVGQTNPDDVIAPVLTGWDRNNFYFDTQQVLDTGSGFEIRYTDESWGADSGKNLVARTTGTTQFAVPRNIRSRVVFIRAYDTRNKLKWSNDVTQTAWGKSAGTTVAQQSDIDPDGDRTQISLAQIPASGTVWQSSSVPATGAISASSVSLKGAAGQNVQVNVKIAGTGTVLSTQTVAMTGDWVRVTVATDGSYFSTGNLQIEIKNTNAMSLTLRITRGALEVGTQAETVFCKTLDTTFGALSRYAAMLRVNFPMIPPSPSAVIDATHITSPVVTINLPDAQQDVWGVEIRDSDNATILYRKNLADADFVPTWTKFRNNVRDLSVFVYTYNLLSEYSDPYNAAISIPEPTVANMVVDEDNRLLRWTYVGAAGALVEIATDSNFYNITYHTVQGGQQLWLGDTEFYPTRWLRITAYDDIGATTHPTSLQHTYNPQAVIEFAGPEVSSVSPPSTPTTDATDVPTAVNNGGWKRQYVEESWRNYGTNRSRYFDL